MNASQPAVGSKVYISYAWQGESEKVANDLDDDFRRRGIPLVRDKRDLAYKGLISGFMKEIGRGDAVVLVICDKYLKSDNCMFELLQVARNPDMVARIFPVVLQDANIYDPEKSVDYIKYWEDKHKSLSTKLKSLDRVGHIEGLDDKLDLWEDIRKGISKLTSTLRDMNALTPEMHANANFEQMIAAVQAQLQRNAAAGVPAATAGQPNGAMSALPDSLQPSAISGFQEALVDLLDPNSALDSVALNAEDNTGELTLLAVLTVQESLLSLYVLEKAEWAGLQLSPEAWTRINRSGAAGSQRTLGALQKLNAGLVEAEVTRLFDTVFGLPDANYSLQATVFDSQAEDETEDGTEEGTEAETEELPALDIEGLDADLAQLVSRRLRQDLQLNVWADEGAEPVCLLSVVRIVEEDSLVMVITPNSDLPAPWRMPRANQEALVNDQGFELDEEGTLTLFLGASSEADAAQLADAIGNALAVGFELPQDECALSSTVDPV